MSDTSRDRGGPWATAGRRHGDLKGLAPLIAVALTGTSIIAVIGTWASARLTLRTVETSRADSEQESVALAVALDDYDRIAQLSDWVSTVGSDLDTATTGRIRWTSVLDGVASTMPEGVGLVRFAGNADSREVSVTVESTSYTTLGGWLAQTTSMSGLADLTLVSATRRPAASSEIDVVEAIARGHLETGTPSEVAGTREVSR